MNFNKLILIIPIFFFAGCAIFLKQDRIDGCNYQGGITKVVSNKGNNRFKFTSFEIGTLALNFDIDICKKSKRDIELHGRVITPLPKNGQMFSIVSRVVIVAATERNNELILNDTLAITNEKGEFSIKAVNHKNTYLVLMQNDTSGTCFELNNFK